MTKLDQPAARLCPICNVELEEVEKGGVVVDMCAVHGMFFDHGEIRALEHRVTKGMRVGLHTKNEMARRTAYKEEYYRHDRAGFGTLDCLYGESAARRSRLARARAAAMKTGAPQLDHDNDSVVPEGKRSCPVCGGLMRTEERKDVWGRTEMIFVDVCDEHGIWLDNSELEILLDRAVQHMRRGVRYSRQRARRENAVRGARHGRLGLNDWWCSLFDLD